ncbi:SurA N-terminal domain-containing protein [Nitrosopumilus sp. K4]|uniref:SurA N-terminal domain-containing protein n=1 Tax=Nitrosopumilus sp. K4 TaxID=2795383 RepID=UPI001BAA3A54|nr:SurA N-terminal domain-containing protein [Nitrosopumilus sp. K4]QUC64157.1 SurA N-terminal domain-containing protein [Nitrosopumilus sp. K4]
MVTTPLGKKPLIGIAAAAIISIAVLLAFSSNDATPLAQTDENPIVAEVNGQKILLDEVAESIRLASMQGQQLNNSTALDQIITKTLLLEEAQERGITVALDDAAAKLEENYLQNGLTKQQFEQRLDQLGSTYDDTLEMYREQMVINQMLIDEISDVEIQISEREAMSFFNENIDTIKSQIGENTVYEDVSSQLKETLRLQKQRQMVSDLVSELRDDATILTFEDRM